MAVIVPMALTDVVMAVLVGHGVRMGRSIMGMRDLMRMDVRMAANQCVRRHKRGARRHKKQTDEIGDREPLSIDNERQKRPYKRCGGIIRARLCRAQVALGPDIHKNVRPYAANPRIIANTTCFTPGSDSPMTDAITKEPMPQHNPFMVTI